MIEIVDCLGRSRTPENIYSDGSWNCPFCFAAVGVGTPAHTARKCPNPACFARGPEHPYPVEQARQALALAEHRAWEDQERQARVEINRRMAEEFAKERQERREEIALEASRRGACPTCALDSIRFGGTPKYVRHRKNCSKRA